MVNKNFFVLLALFVFVIVFLGIKNVDAYDFVCNEKYGNACPSSNSCPIYPIQNYSARYFFEYNFNFAYQFCGIYREHLCGSPSSGQVPPSQVQGYGQCETTTYSSCLPYSFSGSTIGIDCYGTNPPSGSSVNPICAWSHTSKLPKAGWNWWVYGTIPDEKPSISSGGGLTECNDKVNNDCDSYCDVGGCCSDDTYTTQATCQSAGKTWWQPEASCQATCTDNDKDGYGNPGSIACLAGSQQDCNDNDASVYPGAVELCDSKDNDCDLNTDEGCVSCNDNDGDGYNASATGCGLADCNDFNSDVYPGAVEYCNGIDDNCINGIDETGCTLLLCNITNATWVPNYVGNGTNVELHFSGINCDANDTINFTIIEYDPPGAGTNDPVLSFTRNYSEYVTWKALWTYPGDDDSGSYDRTYRFVPYPLESGIFKLSNILNVSNDTITNHCVEDNAGYLCNGTTTVCAPPNTTISSDDIPPGYFCCSGNCCTPQTQAQVCIPGRCGQWPAGCGQIVTCPSCSGIQNCNTTTNTCYTPSDPNDVECKIKSITWNKGKALNGTLVQIQIQGEYCDNGDTISATIWEDDDGGGGTSYDDAKWFSFGTMNNNQTTIPWIAEWTNDTDDDSFGLDPEYYIEVVNELGTSVLESINLNNTGQYKILEVTLNPTPVPCIAVTTCSGYTPYGKAACESNVCDSTIVNDSATLAGVTCQDASVCATEDAYIGGCGCSWNEGTSTCGFTYGERTCPTTGYCGDGNINDGEVCDGTNITSGIDCTDYDYTGGPVTCSSDCLGYNFNQCTGYTCNINGILEPGEFCDGANFTAGYDCTDFDKFTDGELRCNDECEANTFFCYNSSQSSYISGQCSKNFFDAKECNIDPEPGYYIASFNGVFLWGHSGWPTDATCLGNNTGSVSGDCVYDSTYNRWYYDPLGIKGNSCGSGQNRILCPTDIKLPFFGFYQAIITLGVVFVLYFLVNVGRKKKN